MKETKVEIITIGDEILYGQIVNTNSSWISEKLTRIGLKVSRIISIADKSQDILGALEESAEKSDLILLTGGLGPTKDDITKKTLASYFKQEMVFYSRAFENIKFFFKDRDDREELIKLNYSQAYLPANAEAITNQAGTASGMWFEYKGKIFISMPGVPKEMKEMMEKSIIPKLQKLFNVLHIHHKIINTVGCPEAKLAKLLENIENILPYHIKLAYLPSYGQVRLRLTAKGENLEQLKNEINELLPLFQKSIGKYIYSYDDENIEMAIGKILRNDKKTISVAESCTGGLLSYKFTENPGCSSYFKGGIIVYSDEAKQKCLGIKAKTLEQYGAVSQEVAKEMAENIRKMYRTDYGISTTGIAGPSGATAKKPIGKVWIAMASERRTISKSFQFTYKRIENMNLAQKNAMNIFRNFLLEKE